jgi:hypothetical protein
MADQVVLSLVELEALDPRAPAGGAERRFCCPLAACAEKARDGAHRSLSVNVRTGAWRCHRCGGRGLLREQWRPREQQQRAAARRAFAVVPAPPSTPASRRDPAVTLPRPTTRTWDWRAELAAAVPIAGTPGGRYLERRGIPVDVAVAAGVLYAASWCGRPAVVFPLRDRSGAVVAADGRYVDDGDRPKARTGGEKRLGVFATPGALEAEVVAVVEAPICALSLASAAMPALALGGTSAPDWLARAVAFKRVALGLDADETGDRAAAGVAAQLGSLGAVVERWRPVGVKDWNDALRAHGRTALMAALGVTDPAALLANQDVVDESPDDVEALLFADLEAEAPSPEDELDGFVAHLVAAEGPPDPALWDEVLARAWERDGGAPDGLHAALAPFRELGCALVVHEGRVHLGPWEDFAGCGWAGPAEWEADYAVHLAPHAPALEVVLAEALGALGVDPSTRAA